MEKYEKTIGFKTIWLTIIRRFKIVFLIFASVAIITVVYTQFIMTKKYTSTVTLYRPAQITTAQYLIIPQLVKSRETATAVAEKLLALDPVVKHANGNEITVDEIYSGVSIADSITTNVVTFPFSFSSVDKTITQSVLETVADISLEKINAQLPGTAIYNHASAPSKTSKENTYLLIGLAVGAVLALGFSFVYEIISDEIYDKADIENFGCGGFEFTASK